ncbi:L,D-transpeptidase [Tepidibacillus fermentans]|uniref:L,D-transpeptidase-like protein n=1 Tax=Tepidibacillus fermentans TaxID=1281767 RepID=A0A4R3KKN4_9BACI|nr:L,D-transpeptidase [Tepidibacillus fermentans]TCS84207.1 L,D-transpeptidase-like protein [Tepidibacillus fermentans]
MNRNFKILTFVLIIIYFFTYSIFAKEPTEIKKQKNNVQKDIEISMPEGYEGVYLVINKTHNTLKVYLNESVVKTFPVATGKNQSLTPEGQFNIVTKVKKPWYLPKKIPGGDKKNPLGTRWIGLNVPGTSGYKYGIHGTNNPYSIGHHVSQGCIRMHNKDVEWLFRHIPLGTPVIIKSESK